MVGRLDVVDFVIASHDEGQWFVVAPHDQQCLEALLRRDVQMTRDLVDGLAMRRFDLLHLGRGRRARTRGWQRGCRLDIGRELAITGNGQRIFAGGGQYMELLAARAANVAGVGLDNAEIHPDAFEDARVSGAHGLVGVFE